MKTQNNTGIRAELDHTLLNLHILTTGSAGNTVSRARLQSLMDPATKTIASYRLELSDFDDNGNET